MRSHVGGLVLLLVLGRVRAEDWPQFRGPGGQGHSPEQNLPLHWSESQNVTWKVPIPGLGWSSPVITGEEIWLTSGVDEGHSLRVLRLDRQTGRIALDVEVFHKDEPGRIHTKNSHASPTPIVAGERVYVHFGAHGTACLSRDGAVLWRTELRYYHRHGPAGSPALEGDVLIISCDGYDEQYIVGLDARTGQVRWKRERQDGRHAYSTPLVITAAGRRQAISTGGNRVTAYDPQTGQEIWWSRYDGYSLVPRPVFGHGLVFICSGYNDPLVYAIRPTGTGDVTDTHVVWSLKRGAPHNPSPLLVDEELYLVSDQGIASCLDARTGKIHWQQRLEGDYSASLLFADGRIHFLSEEGVCTVIRPGRTYERLAVNRLEGRTLGSLAVSGNAFYLRTNSHLYRIENGADRKPPASTGAAGVP